MKVTRYGSLAAIAMAGALALTACGTDNNTTPSDSSSSGSSSASASAGASGGTNALGVECATGTLTLAGSTAQSNAMSEWIKDYQTACPGATINYGGGGSGAGVKQFQEGTIDFAGSDFALTAADQPAADSRCKTGPAINIPMVPGPIAVGYNVPGVTNPLDLSASTLAGIFGGKITKWNDAAIAKDNPGVNLPSTGIQTFHRSDGSGTSYNFTAYLTNEAKDAWTFGTDKNWKAPGGQGVKGTQGIAQGVKSTPGGIGYMELSFAKNSSIPYSKVSNAKGDFVELSTQNVQNFLAKAKTEGSNGDIKVNFDYTNGDADAYPNLLVTYEIVCSKGNDPQKLPLIKSFLGYIAGQGQQKLTDLSYVPLPQNLQDQVKQSIDSLS